jgi:hypothetical protein
MFTLKDPVPSSFDLMSWQFSAIPLNQVMTPVMLGIFSIPKKDRISDHSRHCEDYILINRFKQVLPLKVPLLFVDNLESAAVLSGDGEGCWGRFRSLLVPTNVHNVNINTVTIIDPDSSSIRWAEISPADKEFYDYLSGLPKLRSV